MGLTRNISKAFTTTRVFKYGAAATAGSVIGGYVSGFSSAEPAHRNELAKSGAKLGAAVTVGAAALLLSRKPLKHLLKGGVSQMNKFNRKAGKVVFRRIRGRLVPIWQKL